jgi:hypothetical protein
MADSKITALTSIGTITDPAVDPLVIVDVSDTSMAATGTTKKVTLNNLLACSPSATLASLNVTGSSIPANGLYLPTTNTLEFAANGLAQYRIAPLGVFSWFDGAGGTRMTLNSTGLGVGDAPAANTRLTLGSVNPTGLNLAFKTTGVTTGRVQTYLGNTSGDLLSGIEGSTAGQTLTGSAAYSGFIGTFTNNPFYLVSNGLIRATIDSSGNVGVGVTPSAWNSDFRALQVSSSGSYVTSYISGATVNQWLFIGNNAFYDSVDSRWEYIRSKPSAQYIQYNNEHQWLRDTGTQTAGAACTFTQAMTLDASGNLLVGTTTTSGNAGGLKLSNVAGNLGQITFSNNSGSADYVARFNWGSTPTLVGNITVSSGGTAFNTTSDYRLKESVQPLVGGLARVNALKPSIYKWKTDGSNGEGFLAHELAEVVPAAVTGEKDAVNEDGSIKPQGVDLSKVVPILVAAIQELTARVQTLEAK